MAKTKKDLSMLGVTPRSIPDVGDAETEIYKAGPRHVDQISVTLPPHSREKKIPILMYHSISEPEHASHQLRPFTVSPARFAEQIKYLSEQGYIPLTVTQLSTLLYRNRQSLPERPVVVTFDDGLADFFTAALPVLKRYNFVATLYITTAFVGGTSSWLWREKEATRPMLTWDQITEINAQGIECGAHSHTHPQLDLLPLSTARSDIMQSKKLLEHHLGQTISSFAYPYGYHSLALQRIVKKAGYTSACAVKYEMSTATSNPFSLGRLLVSADTDVDALATLLTSPPPSRVYTLYKHARVHAGRFIRRHYGYTAQERILTAKKDLVKITMQTCHLYQEITTNTTQPSDFTPIRIVEIELSQGLFGLPILNDLEGQFYRKALCLVRLHSQPLGMVELTLDNGTLSAQKLAYHIWQKLGEQVNIHLLQDGLQPVSTLREHGILTMVTPTCLEKRESFLARAPFASVIVATHNRPELLQRCLKSLLALCYPHYEIIIVDNAPSTSATADLIEQICEYESRVRYVREDRPGPSFARNRGIQEARGEVLAITDDDVVVDPYWLFELGRGFQASEKVVCVSGLVLPMEIETQAQSWLEQYGGYSKGFTRRIFNLGEHHPGTPLFPYTAGILGTGANIAFKASYLRAMGGYDPALGPGTLAKGGEDLAIFFHIIMQGHTIAYEPAALLYHPHHRSYADLCKQMYCYGVGLTAYLTKSVVDRPSLLFDLFKKIPYGMFFTFSPHSPKNNHKSDHYPKELTRLELQGMLYGPLAYFRSRWALHRSRGMRPGTTSTTRLWR